MTKISLQRQLIKTTLLSSVVVSISLLAVVLGSSFWQNVTWQDELMEESAQLILTVDFANKAERKRLDQLQGVMQEFDLQYQLSFEDWILNDYELDEMFTHYDFRSLQSNGMHNIWYDGQFWRVYAAEHDDLKIYMVQPWTARTALLKMPLMYGVLLCLALWFGLACLNGVLIQRALRPVEQVRHAIQQRSIHDLTALDQPAWIEIQPIVDALNTLFRRLEASIQAEQRFTADASHELRTPLSALNMRIQVLLRKYSHDDVITNKLQKMLNDIERSRLMIENLLLLAKIDPKSMAELHLEPCSLQQILQQAISDLAPLIAQKNIDLNLEVDQTLRIQADPALLPIALKNLLENAIKYAVNGTEVRIHFTQYTPLQLVIANHTVLIDPRHLSHLTERFYRIKEQSAHVHQSGSGLGLSIVSKILTLHEIDYRFYYDEQSQYFQVMLTGFKMAAPDES